jgi:hypothetical protein
LPASSPLGGERSDPCLDDRKASWQFIERFEKRSPPLKRD